MAEEEVLLENSPLQKYLDEIGFTDFERFNSCGVQGKCEESLFSSFRTWIKRILHNKALTWESCVSSFVAPTKQDLDAFRKDYIAAVADSEILNEGDVTFLSHFDPELFTPRNPCKSSESHKTRNLLSCRGRHVLSSFVLLVSVLLAAVTDFVFISLSIALIMCSAVGINSLIQYYFSIHHQRNLGKLTLFTMQMKQLALLLRKSIKLIQEMELLSKGYTMVGPAIPAFLDNGDNLTRSIYPALRKVIVGNTENVTSCLQKSAKELVLCFPLSMEHAGIFTYLTTGSEQIVSVSYNEGLSLQSLKTMTSLLFSLQSEFLSRFLLCLSVEANDGNLYELYFKLFKKINKIFGISSEVIAASVTSIERSYHIHKSYCFTSEESLKHHTRPHTKWAPLDAALHSLQLHLQAGILRVQSLQQVISKEEELNPTDSTCVNSDLETAFQWLKIDLESAFSCWKEGEKSVNKLSGRETTEQPINKTSNTANSVNLEETTEPLTLDLNEEVSEIDRVYEAFSEPYDEALNSPPALTAEDLEREKTIVKENKQLLQELKAVLFTKTKDPLISTDGFVPPVKSPEYIQTGSSNVINDMPNSDNAHSENKAVETSDDELCADEQFKTTEGYNQLQCDVEARPMLTNLQSSVAVSVAAAAVMRSKAMGLREENFIGDDDSD